MKKQNTLFDIRLTKEERDFLISVGGNRARKILSHATEINPALPENQEILTDKKMNELFSGKPYILYYNFDASNWNSARFMGHVRPNITKDTYDVIEMKKTLEKQLNFIDKEIVAVVIITAIRYPGWGDLTHYHAICPDAKNTAVGTLVCRNKKTGKIMQQPKQYIGIGRYLHESAVPEYAVQAFARDAMSDTRNSKFAKTLNELYKLHR